MTDTTQTAALDADGLDIIEALVSDACIAESPRAVHEGGEYYAERIVRRALEQGTLALAKPPMGHALASQPQCDADLLRDIADEVRDPDGAGTLPLDLMTRIDATLSTQPSESEGLAAELESEWLRGDWYEKWQDATENADDDLMATLEALRGRVDQTIIAALRSADRSAVLTGWQPIETAPKDGMPFVGSDGKYAYRTRIGKYYVKFPHEDGGPSYDEKWNAEDSGSVWPWHPTHWMPLPEAPSRTALQEIAR